jgi:hypothetical protein
MTDLQRDLLSAPVLILASAVILGGFAWLTILYVDAYYRWINP